MIGSIAEEIAFEYGYCTLQFVVDKMLVSVKHSIELLLKREQRVVDAHHHMELVDATLLKTENPCFCMLKGKCFVHLVFQFACKGTNFLACSQR